MFLIISLEIFLTISSGIVVEFSYCDVQILEQLVYWMVHRSVSTLGNEEDRSRKLIE